MEPLTLLSIIEDKENQSASKSDLTLKKEKKRKEKKIGAPEHRINPLLGPLQRSQGPSQPEK